MLTRPKSAGLSGPGGRAADGGAAWCRRSYAAGFAQTADRDANGGGEAGVRELQARVRRQGGDSQLSPAESFGMSKRRDEGEEEEEDEEDEEENHQPARQSTTNPHLAYTCRQHGSIIKRAHGCQNATNTLPKRPIRRHDT